MLNQPGVLQQPTSLLLTTSSVTDVLSMAAGEGVQTVTGWKIVNADSTDRVVSLWWNDGTTDFLIFKGTIGANSTMWDDDANILLYAKSTARKIKAQAATGNVVTVTLTKIVGSQTNQDANQPSSGR